MRLNKIKTRDGHEDASRSSNQDLTASVLHVSSSHATR